MKTIKKLLEADDDKALLTYLRGNFKNEIDDYIIILDEAPKLQNEILRLKRDGLDRQIELEQYKKRVDKVMKNIPKI